MNAARVRVTPALLFQHLPFPEGTQILSVRMTYEWNAEFVEFVVSHSSLPAIEPDGTIPLAEPKFTRRVTEVQFVEWGL